MQIAPTQVQDIAPGLAELHKVGMDQPLKSVQDSLNSISSLQHVSCTIELDIICQLAEGALNPTDYKDVK